LLKIILLLSVALVCPTVFAELEIIVHPSNNTVISSNDIKRIFLGKKKTFPNGDSAIAIIPDNDKMIITEFNKIHLKKSPSQYKAYWTRRIFTGRGGPPMAFSSQDIIKLVAENPSYISYVNSNWIDNSVKVVNIK